MNTRKRPSVANRKALKIESRSLFLVLSRTAHSYSNRRDNAWALNDEPRSPVVTTIIGEGNRQLTDLRPAERDLSSNGNWSASESSKPAWTSYFEEQGKFDRLEYILLSPEMKRYCAKKGTFVPALEYWRLASDHRPVVAKFHIGKG